MTKEKGKSTRRNSGLGERLTQLLSNFRISQKEAAQLAIGGDGKPTRLSVLHGWCTGTNCTDYKALQNLCRALTARRKEPVCFEWLLTGEASSHSVPVIQNETELAKLFLHEDDVFDGFVRVKISKISLKKGQGER